MCNKSIYSISVIMLLVITSSIYSEPFNILVEEDGHVCNDSQHRPGQAYVSDGVHIRNVPDRRRIGYLMFDISELKGPSRVFSKRES